MFPVSELLFHLRFQSGLQNVLRQPIKQPFRANEINSLLPGLGQELQR
jgi:hypothetical protein